MSDSNRDASLDALRCVAIIRVIAMHTLSRLHPGHFVALTFVFPGMPIVFAVSGAVAWLALSSGDRDERGRFWRKRAHRLLWPYWTYVACVVVLLFVTERVCNDSWHHFDHSGVLDWFLPIFTPAASPAFSRLGTHLWFLAPFAFLLALAPLTIALHRRAPCLGAAVFAAAAVALVLSGCAVPAVVRDTLAYGAAFQFGFALADGRLARVPRAALVAGAALLASAGVALHQRFAPDLTLQDLPIANVLVGFAWLGVWLVLREPIARAFARPVPAAFCRAVNRRSYTLYLWGPAANDVAIRVALQTDPAMRAFALFALTAVVLVSFAWVFGRVEDMSAQRTPATLRLGRARAGG